MEEEEGDGGADEDEGQVALLGLVVAPRALALRPEHLPPVLSSSHIPHQGGLAGGVTPAHIVMAWW